MVAIRQVPAGRVDRQYSGTNPCIYITVHETDNTSRGAGAQAHANYQRNGGGGASWHYQVDDKGVIQSYPDNRRLFHAGDGRGHGNMSSIAIETCVNPDSDWGRTKQNLVELIRVLMQRHGIPASRVVQHNHWSGKNCPRRMRASGGREWRDVRAAISGSRPVSKPPTTGGKKKKIAEDQFWGRDTTFLAQEVYTTPRDGTVSSQAAAWKKLYGSRLTAGWQWVNKPRGSQLIRAMQTVMKNAGHKITKIDGLIGPEFIAAFISYMGGGNLKNAIGNFQIRLNRGEK